MLAARVQLTQRQTSETRQALDEAREALLAFAAAWGRLPCPASSGVPGQGLENCSIAASGGTQRGLLPWETLGIRGVDGWNRRLAYITTKSLATPGVSVTLSSLGSVVVSAGAAGGGTSLASTGAVAAAVWSFGANGKFATLTDGTVLPGDIGTDEQTNSTSVGGNTVVSRDESENTSIAGGTFDDQVIWISRYVLFGRMMSAGQLP